MKKFIRYIPVLLALTALLGSCMNVLDTPAKPGTISEGKGRLTIRVEDRVRTALPSGDFDKYMLRFVYGGTEGYTHDDVEWDAEVSVDLEPGSWTVYADAYSGEFISGTGSATGTVSAGAVTPIVIRIGIGPDMTITGDLKYTVNYPAVGEDHAYEIQRLIVFDTTDTPAEVSGSPVTVANGMRGTLNLVVGVYTVRVIIEDTIQRTSASETRVAHIYGGQDTIMVFTITPEQFTAHVPLTVTAGLTVPGGLDDKVGSRKIAAYEDADCAKSIGEKAEGPASSGQAEFVLWIPSIYEKVYLRQEIEVDGYPYYGYGREVGIDSDTPATEGFNEVYYAIGVDSPMNNGAVAPYGAMGLSDTEIRLTVTPNTGFALKNGTLKYHKGINDYDITGTDPDYSFTMPASDVTISAFFNRRLLLDFIAIEGPSDLMVPVTITHSAGTTSTDISWLDKETLTFTVDADYSKEAGNLKWLVNGKELSATGSSLTISAQTYVLRRYTLTVMIKEDDQWYSGEQSFTVTK